METPQHHILIVDDEESLCEILSFNLRAAGYQTSVAYSAEEALTLPLEKFDLILLDVMMGELSGFGLARILRKRPETADTPIIFCTALDSEADKIKGLDIGADDYISKPFSLAEVMARVRSVLRRSKRTLNVATSNETPVEEEQKGDDSIIRFEALVVNNRDKSCYVENEEIQLTRKEFDILVLLLSNRGTILSREQIMKRVWSEEVVVLDRTIDVNITRLRKKLGIYGNHIITRTGYGYGFKI
jgi:two-component system phosphate regulon response regulator PhoB